MSVSVFIQTLDEEKNLPRCLEAVAWSDDIVVLDSGSRDRTEEIARHAGARFYQRPYDGRANNQNWAVENIHFAHPWVWYVDADEVTPPELADEIRQVTAPQAGGNVAYSVRRRNFLVGRWLRYGGLYQTWITRLWQPGKIKWRRGANPVAIIDGPVGRLRNPLTHYFFSKGFGDWFERHNRYSEYEAVETIASLKSRKLPWRDLLSKDYVRRRRSLKELSFRLPGRPWLKFIYMYFARGGFLDGRPGLTYCTLQAIYEYMICLKVKELKRERHHASSQEQSEQTTQPERLDPDPGDARREL